MVGRRARLRAIGWTAVALAAAAPARAGDRVGLDGMIDVRAIATDATPSFMNGGLGRLRVDDAHDGLRVDRAFVAARWRLSDTLVAHAVADAYGDGQQHGIGASQAYLEWRPFPLRSLRWRIRAGAFFPPVSLEHRTAGWSSPYTLSASAINTWIGEEFRVLGTEIEARWLGASSGYRGDVALIAGAFGWNDPAGALIADRGWALHDRTSLLFGRIGRPPLDLYREIDGRPGYYGGIAWRHRDVLEVRALHYDNRADPGAVNAAGVAAWETRFSSLGVRFEPSQRLTLLAQHLEGKTFVGPDAAGEDQFAARLESWFVLASVEFPRGRASLRFDHFMMRQDSGFYGLPDDDAGHAVTIAWLQPLSDHWQVAAEWLRVQSAFPPRAEAGLPARVSERQLQLALRYRFHVEAGTTAN